MIAAASPLPKGPARERPQPDHRDHRLDHARLRGVRQEADAWEHANHLDLRAVCEKLIGHADDLAAALKRSEPELLRRLINALEPLA